MNTTHQPTSSTTPRTGPHRVIARLVACVLVAGFTGCSFLKPAQSTTRHYVLTPIPANAPADAGSLAIGVGQVKLPAYLFDTSVALRRGTNEVEYLPAANWAERLDAGFQRVLAANLATLLPADRVYLSAWQKSDVTAEVHVIIEQFDVDASGRGQLVARWHIGSPGGDKVLQSGTSRLTHAGASPETDVSGAVATLSELIADFSRELAQSLRASNLAR
jgi:uncharacterized lipoprotein YmbA